MLKLRGARTTYFNKAGRLKRKTTKRIPLRRMPRAVIPEIKKIDFYLTATQFGVGSTDAVIRSPCQIAAGDNIANRTGNKVFMKYLLIRGDCTIDADDPLSLCRLEVMLDKQPNAGTATWANMYEATGNAVLDVHAQRAFATATRFKTLKSKTFKLGLGTTADGAITSAAAMNGNSPGQFHFKWKIPVNKYMTYVDGSAAVPTTNNIVIVVWGQQAVATGPLVNYTVRGYFSDA